jgi:hypothetical protein
MRLAPLFALCLLIVGCRIEKVRAGDTTRMGVDPGPGIPPCGISPESRVSEDGLGLLRVGVTLESVRGSCAVIAEKVTDSSGSARIDLGRDTALVDLNKGIIRRITLSHQAYRTADSLGVGTHISTLLRLREATAITDGERLYAISPAYCGLRFLLLDPAPKSDASRTGRVALRRLPGETRTQQLEIVGCVRRH